MLREPLYDVHSSFWENFHKGPRRLLGDEKRRISRLERQIDEMEETEGLSTEVTLFGKKVGNPIGLASGPAPNYKWLEFFAKLGYGVITYKTMRDRRWDGHGLPNLMHVSGDFRHHFVASDRVTGSITNSLGMPTPEPNSWKEDARRVAEANGDRFFVMSVTATVGEGDGEHEVLSQFSELALEGKRAGADAVELNLSCPNVLPGEGGETFRDPRLSGRVVDAVRRSVGSDYPVLAKVGYLNDYSEFVERTYDERVGYVAINSVPGIVRNSSGEVLFKDRGGRAGICGAAIRDRARRAVSNLASLRRGIRHFEIAGLGGVLGTEDAIALMDRGADVIESATGALLNPCLALEMRLGLLKLQSERRQQS